MFKVVNESSLFFKFNNGGSASLGRQFYLVWVERLLGELLKHVIVILALLSIAIKSQELLVVIVLINKFWIGKQCEVQMCVKVRE